MLKFIRKFLGINMESDESAYDMLDILAFNCSKLANEMADISSNEEQNKILFDYIKKADAEHKSINDFKEDLDWFNVTEPLSTKDTLLGKIVILDFFTYCCINCMHILPDLKKLEQLYTVDDGLVVIGVHSAKFDNEKDSSNILSAVQRYNITHPVVNDGNSAMWMDLKIKCWPTLLVLGPRANPLFVLMGEGNYDTLEKYIGSAIKYYKNSGHLKSHALPLNPATDLIMSSTLKFPGKIVCSKTHESDDSAAPELYAISDSGNHRILVVSANGTVLHKVGGKTEGFTDGDFKTARFNSPQGLTFLNDSANIIFVADTENHAIRKINLTQQTVETIAGTGVQGQDRVGGKIGKEQELSSPWDVAVYQTRDMDMSFHIDEEQVREKDILLIAIAGLHQIWAIFLEEVIWWKFKKYPAGSVVAIAGNGKEENRNNSYPQNAAFAQPSGLAIGKDAKELYIADSESSCVRKLSLNDGKVLAVAGADRNPLNLFAYGDVDGKQFVAKMQHPLGVAYNPKDQSIYVADTYNHKIKRIDAITNACTTCDIAFDANSSNGMQLTEPGGLCVNPAGDHLYIADTNNHRIEIVNLQKMTTRTMKLVFYASSSTGANSDLGPIVQSKQIKMKPQGGKLKLVVAIMFSDGETKLTEDAPQKWNVFMPNDKWLIQRHSGTFRATQSLELDITVPSVTGVHEEESIALAFKLNVCARDICFPKLFSITFPVLYSHDGGGVEGDCVETIKAVISDDMVTLL